MRVSRILLLALLPLVALAVYLKGQHYDPGLVDFTSVKDASSMATFFPAGLEGLLPAGAARSFGKDTLSEYVDGHAEYFLNAGFVQLLAMEYALPGGRAAQPELIVDIYDMGKAIQAFGVLVDEAGNDASAVDIGAMGFLASQGLSFIADRYYVKLTAFKEGLPLSKAAQQVAEAIGKASGAGKDGFSLFARFPDIGKVKDTRFIKDNYRGLDFLHDVIERRYDLGDGVQIFLVTGSTQKMKEITATFMEFFKSNKIKFTPQDRKGRTIYRIEDPYEGDWLFIPQEDALFGVYGKVEDSLLDRIVDQMASSPLPQEKRD